MGAHWNGGVARAYAPGPAVTRRDALKTLLGVTGALALGSRNPSEALAAVSDGGGHPEPRPGIDASSVLPRDGVAPHAADLYDQVREIPHIVDGIRCQCGCADLPGMYSLLSCYGASGMAQYCDICSGEGRLAYRLHTQGKSLDDIRAAVDRRFG
ncbi:MAG TPA: twin-arginine translocation signal domain-containing protein [Longimicrobiales bacterium]|nr:twin-arginine translocation signal domain-containing protein [Longimicrobiales bacterium]